MISLIEKQTEFAFLVAELILQSHSMGYSVTLGEAWRSDETAKIDALENKGVTNSLHRLRLAIDINLFKKDGVNWIYLSDTKDYKPLGLWWESQSLFGFNCVWGGRFGDGNHFSMEHLGVK